MYKMREATERQNEIGDKQMNFEIIYEDADILVCYKPSGVPTQTSKFGQEDMVSLLKNYLYQNQKEKKEPYIAVIHRLDQPVEGLLVFGKTPHATKELSKSMQKSDFGRYYKAVICNTPQNKQGMLEDYLVKDGKTNISRIAGKSEKDAKKALLFYEVLETITERGEQRSLVKIKLETGRHHQIRVQMANMGCPIWGDTKYGQSQMQEKSWRAMALCSYRLEIEHPRTRKKLEFQIEPKGEGFTAFWLDSQRKFP